MKRPTEESLRMEVTEWVDAGVIDREQGDAILARYPERRGGGWMIAYAVIGTLLCVAGVSLLIASNWAHIPPLMKLCGLLLLLAVSTVIGVEAAVRRGRGAVSECGFIGAAIFPLLGIALISQIFHLDGSFSGLAAAWSLAILPLPFLSRSGGAFLAWLASGYWWLGARLTEDMQHMEWWQMCAVFAGAGALLALGSQFWLRWGESRLRGIGEYVGVATVGISVFSMGFDIVAWAPLWIGLFVVALGWIWLSLERGRPHQVTLGFVVVGGVMMATFLRLAGTMTDTGVLFVTGGVALLGLTFILNRVRRRLLKRIP